MPRIRCCSASGQSVSQRSRPPNRLVPVYCIRTNWNSAFGPAGPFTVVSEARATMGIAISASSRQAVTRFRVTRRNRDDGGRTAHAGHHGINHPRLQWVPRGGATPLPDKIATWPHLQYAARASTSGRQSLRDELVTNRVRCAAAGDEQPDPCTTAAGGGGGESHSARAPYPPRVRLAAARPSPPAGSASTPR